MARKNPKVALLVENSREWNRELVRGIIKYARLNGPWTFCRMPPQIYKSHSNKKITIKTLKNIGADVIIAHVMEPRYLVVDSVTIEELISLGLPMLVAGDLPGNEIPKNIINLNSDLPAIGRMGADYLLSLGFHNYALYGFVFSKSQPDDLSRGFSEFITKYGFKVQYYKTPKSKPALSSKEQQVSLIKWLKTLPKPIAIMAANDDLGQEVLDACKLARFRVPEEIAVLGVDNDPFICEIYEPTLSSIALDVETAGYRAAEALSKLMAGIKVTDRQVLVSPVNIAPRQSTDTLAVEDEDVLNAMRFIRQNSQKAIQVSDVSDAVALSRRTLEKRFRKVANRSVADEIRRVRMDEIIRLLADTSLPISKIASALGFHDAGAFCKHFHREKAMSPTEWRKKYFSK
jgi:LacI family transcriptional regulator